MDAQLTIVDVTGSTNDDLLEAGKQGAPHGTGLAARAQTAGRGRRGHKWDSTAGNLLLSIVLRPCVNPAKYSGLAAVSGLAVLEALEKQGLANEIGLKWPNDLVFSGKKLCGILLEISADLDQIEYVVVGTGLNVLRGAYPPELYDRAAALEEFAEPPVRREIVVHYLKALEDNMTLLEEHGFPGIQEAYRRHCCTLGSRVHVIGTEIDFIGTAEDIDETGALLVRDESGVLQRVLSGDVSVRGVMGYV